MSDGKTFARHWDLRDRETRHECPLVYKQDQEITCSSKKAIQDSHKQTVNYFYWYFRFCTADVKIRYITWH